MKAQYNSRCGTCGGPIAAGTDIFYERGDGGHHWECRENMPPSAEQIELAERLGFLPTINNERSNDA